MHDKLLGITYIDSQTHTWDKWTSEVLLQRSADDDHLLFKKYYRILEDSTPPCESRRINNIVGDGLFATRDIAAGEIITHYGGTMYPHEVFMDKSVDKSTLWRRPTFVVIDRSRKNLGCKANHAPPRMSVDITEIAEANAKPRDFIHNGRPVLCYVAAREIKRGEQILLYMGNNHISSREIMLFGTDPDTKYQPQPLHLLAYVAELLIQLQRNLCERVSAKRKPNLHYKRIVDFLFVALRQLKYPNFRKEIDRDFSDAINQAIRALDICAEPKMVAEKSSGVTCLSCLWSRSKQASFEPYIPRERRIGIALATIEFKLGDARSIVSAVEKYYLPEEFKSDLSSTRSLSSQSLYG